MARFWSTYLALACVSGAALLYEIALTRVFAIAQGYHFGFLAISLALLGFGASGTALALGRARLTNPSLLAGLALLLALGFPGSYLLANALPFDAYRIAWEPVQFLYLAAYLLALVVPFFLAGLFQALPLVIWAERTGSLYAANLVGSGLGGLLALAALNWTSAEGAVLIAALLASAAALVLAIPPAEPPAPLTNWLVRWAAAAGIVVSVNLLAQVPDAFEIRLSPYKPQSQLLNYPDARILARRENAFSRVEVIESSNIRSAPGLSLSFAGTLPPQTGLVVDADTVLALTAPNTISPALVDALPASLPYRLRPRARVLLIEPGGGLDVGVALRSGAASVVVVQQNPLLVDLIQHAYADRAGGLYADPRVRVVTTGGRGYSARSAEQFDLVELALSDNFRAVTAGAFTLSEDYALTVQAFRSYLARLAPQGLFVVQRWLQLPPTEELRAAALVLTALQESGVRQPAQNLVALRSFSTLLLLARREPFTAQDVEPIKTWARERQFDFVYYPGIRREEANRFNVLQRDEYFDSFQNLMAGAEQFFRTYPYDVAPPTDDHPFFFHFFKWQQLPAILALLGKTWQPFGGSGYLILLALLALVFVLALALVGVPLAVTRRRARGAHAAGWMRPLVYFGALGLGFLFFEIPLIQQFTLFLDYPVYAFTVVVFALLVFSGVGSAFAAQAPWRAALVALGAAAVVYPWLLSQIFALFLGQDLPARVLVALVVLAPLGFLLGLPFPRGLAVLGRQAPDLVPLAWAVNGSTSVLSSILATLFALSWGLTPVLFCAGAAYLLALAARPRAAANLT